MRVKEEGKKEEEEAGEEDEDEGEEEKRDLRIIKSVLLVLDKTG